MNIILACDPHVQGKMWFMLAYGTAMGFLIGWGRR